MNEHTLVYKGSGVDWGLFTSSLSERDRIIFRRVSRTRGRQRERGRQTDVIRFRQVNRVGREKEGEGANMNSKPHLKTSFSKDCRFGSLRPNN